MLAKSGWRSVVEEGSLIDDSTGGREAGFYGCFECPARTRSTPQPRGAKLMVTWMTVQ